MTLKQKVLEYLRTHKEPFTLAMIVSATGGRLGSVRHYLSLYRAEGLVAFAEPKTHQKATPGKPFGNWNERKYTAT